MDEHFNVGEQIEHDRLILRLLFEFGDSVFNLFGVVVKGDDAFFSLRRVNTRDYGCHSRLLRLLSRHITLFYRGELSCQPIPTIHGSGETAKTSGFLRL